MNLEGVIRNAFASGEQGFDAYFRKDPWGVRIKPFIGIDYSSTTAIFPGQGIAFEGQFGEWLKGQSRLRDYFQTADAFAQSKGWQRPSLYLTAPQRINPTNKAKLKNLALFTLEVSLFEELSRLGFSFRRLAGYSFGEYAGWTAAGVLSFAQMLEVVYWREELSPAPFAAGAMVLVGASVKKVEADLSAFKYYVANRNLPEQFILAAENDVADQIVKKLFGKRILCQKVQELSQPYHSPLLQPTADLLAAKLAELKLEIGVPRVPYYSSVLNRWVHASDFDRREFLNLLSRQLTEPVDFMKLKAGLAKDGRQSVMELGPATSCSDMLRRLDDDQTFKHLPLSNYFRGEAAQRKEYDEKVRKSKFVSVVSRVVSRLTGYEVEDIVIEDRFQEDLGIDSLKKAEVMFEVLHEAKVNLEGDLNTSRFKSLGDLVEYLEVGPESGGTQQTAEKFNVPFSRYVPSWINQLETLHLPLKDSYREFQFSTDRVFSDSVKLRADILEQFKVSSEVPLLLRLDCGARSNAPTLESWSGLVRFWRELLNELSEKDRIRLALVGDLGDATYEGLLAFFKSISREQLQLTFVPIACDSARPSSDWLWAQIQRPRLAERKYTSTKTSERSWTKLESTPKASAEFRPTKMVWLGGSGGIAYELLSRYPQRNETDLHVIGRRPFEDLEIQDRIGMLEIEFASVNYYQADASNAEELHKTLSEIDKNCGGLELAVNATGVDRSSLLKVKLDADIEDELRQKILPVDALTSWCGAREGVRQVHFSSIVGLFGNSAQSVYGLGNACLAAEVARADKNAMVVHWPAWQNVGMTARSAVRLTLMESGVPLLQPEDGARFFWEDVQSGRSGDVTYITEPYLYSEQLRDVNYDSIRDFFGSIPKASKRVIEKRFDLNDDNYLLDHRIQGKPCVPAAAVLTMFLEMSYLLEGRFKTINDFEMMNMLIVDPEGMSSNLVLRPATEGVMLQLRSLLPHARAVIGKEEDSKLELRLPIATEGSVEEIPMQQYYASGILFHGPRHQMLAKTWKIDSDIFRAKVERTKLAELHGNEFFDVLMPMFDGVFQLLVISSYLKRHIKALPIAVKSLRLHPEVAWTDNLWIQTEILDFSEGVVQGAGLIYNDNGEVLVELRGVTVQEGTTAFSVTH